MNEETILQIRQRLAKLDASGEDYIVDDVGTDPTEKPDVSARKSSPA